MHGQGFSCIENYEAAAKLELVVGKTQADSHVQASLNSVH